MDALDLDGFVSINLVNLVKVFQMNYLKDPDLAIFKYDEPVNISKR